MGKLKVRIEKITFANKGTPSGCSSFALAVAQPSLLEKRADVCHVSA